AARVLAQQALRRPGALEDRLTYLFQRATSRTPTPRELAELAGAYADHLAEFTRDQKAAGQLIATGTTRPDATMNPAELAALTMVANLILNLDEVITKG